MTFLSRIISSLLLIVCSYGYSAEYSVFVKVDIDEAGQQVLQNTVGHAMPGGFHLSMSEFIVRGDQDLEKNPAQFASKMAGRLGKILNESQPVFMGDNIEGYVGQANPTRAFYSLDGSTKTARKLVSIKADFEAEVIKRKGKEVQIEVVEVHGYPHLTLSSGPAPVDKSKVKELKVKCSTLYGVPLSFGPIKITIKEVGAEDRKTFERNWEQGKSGQGSSSASSGPAASASAASAAAASSEAVSSAGRSKGASGGHARYPSSRDLEGELEKLQAQRDFFLKEMKAPNTARRGKEIAEENWSRLETEIAEIEAALRNFKAG